MAGRMLRLGLWGLLLFGCGRSGNFAPGQALFNWEIRNATTNLPVACQPNETIVFDFGGGYAWSFPCSSMSGITPLIAVGDYGVVASATLQGGMVESATDNAIRVTISPSATTQVAPVIFLVNRQ